MNESTLLIAASAAMVVLAAIAACLLFLLNASPIWVVAGGTLAGIVVYVAFFLVGGRYPKQDLHVEEEANV